MHQDGNQKLKEECNKEKTEAKNNEKEDGNKGEKILTMTKKRETKSKRQSIMRKYNLEKLFDRKKTSYHKRLEDLHEQWVNIYEVVELSLFYNLKASMPPGWTRTVNSACLIDSFLMVDKIKWEKSKSMIAKTCQACNIQLESETTNKRESFNIAHLFNNIVQNLPRGEELVKILIFCKHMTLNNEPDFDPSFCSKLLSTSWSQLMSSPSPYLMHLLHFTREELADLCKPKEGLIVSLFIKELYN